MSVCVGGLPTCTMVSMEEPPPIFCASSAKDSHAARRVSD